MRVTAARLAALLLLLICSWADGAERKGAVAPVRWEGLAEPTFEHINRKSGLIDPYVNAIAQTGEGFLWIATEAGLDRFDGYELKPYAYDPDSPGSLPDNDVLCLHVDPVGRLWVGMRNAGLALFNAQTERFETVPIGRGGLAGAEVTALADDGAGGLWVGTHSGLSHFNPATGAITTDRHVPSDATSLPSDEILAVLTDRAGATWVGTGAGLVRRNADTGGYVALHGRTEEAARALADRIQALLLDSGGHVWFGTPHYGVVVVDPATGTVEPMPTDAIDLRGGRINSLAEIQPGTVWIGTDTFGVVTVDTATKRLRAMRHNPLVAGSLADDLVTYILPDRSGLVWVGTETGLDRFDPATAAVAVVYAGPGHPEGITAPQITAVAAARSGLVWLGVNGEGIEILDPLGQRVAAMPPDPRHPDRALMPGTIFAITMAADDSAWIGTDHGLYHAAPAGASIAAVRLDVLGPSPTVRALLLQGDDLWIGTLDGLLRFRVASQEVRLYAADPDGTLGLTDGRITALRPATEGRIWVGTERGLNLLDPATGSVERMLADPNDRAAMTNSTIWTLALDDRQRLWLGSDSGIDLMESRDGAGKARFRHLGIRDGLPNSLIDGLITDRQGRIWASTDNGLAIIDPDTLAVRPMLEAEGVTILTYWQQSVAQTPQGELLFGGAGGLTIVRTEAIAPPATAPPLVFTAAQIGERVVPVASLNRIGPGRALTLSPDERGLRLAFAGLDFVAADRERYAYRLDGFDADWAAAPQRLATYTNLPPGDFALHLRVQDRQAGWMETVQPLPVHVLPHWYQQLWFRIMAVAGAGLAVAGMVQLRTAALNRRRAALQALVEQRTAELVTVNRQLEALATTDALTGLYNRRRFMEVAMLELDRSRRLGHPLCVGLVDLDHFKVVNDTAGHLAGDSVLRTAARRLQERCRVIDTLARYGGEEFVILMPETALEAAVSACERLRIAVSQAPIDVDGRNFEITVSVGIAQWARGAESIEGLIDRADRALYGAKQRGRNRTELAPA